MSNVDYWHLPWEQRWGPAGSMTLGQNFERRFLEPKNFSLQIDDGPALGIVELEQVSREPMRVLADLGAGPGTTLGLLLDVSVPLFAYWIANFRLGATDTILNPALKGRPLQHALRVSGTTIVVTQRRYREVLDDALVDDLEHITVYEIEDDDERAAASDGAPANVVTTPRDIAAILFTSGTTGPSKAVEMTQTQVHVIANQVIDGIRLGEDDTLYCFHPMHHMTGKYGAFLACLLAGARLVLDTQFEPATWLDRVRQVGATVSIGHGPMFEMIHSTPEKPDDHENPLRVMVSSPMPERIADDFERRFDMKSINVYGMTEVSCVTWHPYDEPPNRKAAGKPLEMFDVRIVDPETDERLPNGTVGEIVVRHHVPWTISPGYRNMPEATQKAWRNLWFHTGDLGRVEDDGYLYFVDRVADRIRRKAENISAEEIEGAILESRLVAETAVVGIAVPDRSDDEIKAYLVLGDREPFELVDLVRWLTTTLPRHMVPRYFEFIDELPRTPTSKVQRGVLRSIGLNDATVDRVAAGIRVRDLLEADQQ